MTIYGFQMLSDVSSGGGVMSLYDMGGVYPYIGTPQRRGFLGCIKLITPYYSRISCGTSILLNVTETRMDNREWIIQRHRKHWEQSTERRQTKHKNTNKKTYNTEN
jgi:hypothetical protein